MKDNPFKLFQTMGNCGKWISVLDALPKEGDVVETKIDDDKGCRNVQKLKLNGRLWFSPDEKCYAYYSPTHWRLIDMEKHRD